jgi:molybdopterin molybdotransferase
VNEPSLSVADALLRIIGTLQPLENEPVPLNECLDRILAEEIRSGSDIPPFPSSSMDGYAVQAADVENASTDSPVRLHVIGEIVAGDHDLPSLTSGQAIRIMTGAPLGRGADAVIPIEFTSEPGPMAGVDLPARVDVIRGVSAGDYTRKAGQDVPQGTKVFAEGHRIRPQDVGMLAALGVTEPSVFRRPRTAILSIGDELLDVSKDLEPGKIRDANSRALVAACKAAGAEPIHLGIAPDDPDKLADCLDEAVDRSAHMILTSGGLSMGAYDFVRTVVEQHGHLNFWRVNMRPGKPLAYGEYRDVPIMALPGNPVSALVTFEVFVRPALGRLGGRQHSERMRVRARVEEDIDSDGRESYLRARVRWHEGMFHANLTGSQDSGVLTSLVKAHALIVIPAGTRRVSAGDEVEAWLLGMPASSL